MATASRSVWSARNSRASVLTDTLNHTHAAWPCLPHQRLVKPGAVVRGVSIRKDDHPGIGDNIGGDRGPILEIGRSQDDASAASRHRQLKGEPGETIPAESSVGGGLTVKAATELVTDPSELVTTTE